MQADLENRKSSFKFLTIVEQLIQLKALDKSTNGVKKTLFTLPLITSLKFNNRAWNNVHGGKRIAKVKYFYEQKRELNL